jgi:plastocyanin
MPAAQEPLARRPLPRPAPVLAVAVLLLAGLGLAAPVLADTHNITIVDNAYQPPELTVFVGEPVIWTNGAARAHTVNSDEGNELDSGGALEPTETYGHVFEQPGRYTYHCEIHGADMAGAITVLPAPETTPPETITPSPPEGTLPPGFSPHTPPGTLTPPPDTSPGTPAPTASPGPGDGSATGVDPALLVGVVLLAGVAGALGWLWLRRRGR